MSTKTIFTVFILCIVHSFVAMDQSINTKTENQQVFDLVVHYLKDHEAICSFAATNKYHDKLMKNTANSRKKLLHSCPDAENNFGNFVHKYGCARCWAYKRLFLNELALGHHQLGYSVETSCFNCFTSPLVYESRLFFNKQGVASFYGFGRLHDGQRKTVICYSIESPAYMCIIQKKDGSLWSMNNLLSHPSLLQAILTLDKKENMTIEDESDLLPCLVFSLDDLIIPDDYEKRIPFGCTDDNLRDARYTTYFPDYEFSEIIEKYKTQHQSQ